jgi:C4-dicarboxylate transporter DctM subunit
MTALILFGSLAAAFLIGMPIGFALGFSSLVAIYHGGGGVTPILMIQKMFASNDSFPLMAIPFSSSRAAS